MGGGQAGAPADDDHVPWSRPPRRGHRDRGWSRRGPARALAAGPVHVTGPERADARTRGNQALSIEIWTPRTLINRSGRGCVVDCIQYRWRCHFCNWQNYHNTASSPI